MGIALVFSGGSTKVPLHIGAVRAIEDSGIKPNKFYGTSAGGIIAACLSYGMKYENLFKVSLSLDFSNLLKNNFTELINNILSTLSIVNGDRFYDLYDSIFGDTTFNQLLYPCYIVGHCLDKCTYEVFSQESSPNMKIKDALRISSSVPMLIKPIKYNNMFYVDGGLSKNFPIDIIPKEDIAIGHIINSPIEYNLDEHNIVTYGIFLIDQLIQSNVENSIKNTVCKNIIVKSEYPIKTTQFNVPLEDKLRMMDIGYMNMKLAISKL